MNRQLALAIAVMAFIALCALLAYEETREWDEFRIAHHCYAIQSKDPATGLTDYRCDDSRVYQR